MNESEAEMMFTRMNKNALNILNDFPAGCQQILSDLHAFREELLNKISEDYKKPHIKTPKPKYTGHKRRAFSSSSEDEEVSSVSKAQTETSNASDSILNASEKPKRNASKMAQEKINKQAHIKLNTKMRRPSGYEKHGNDINSMSIKVEKEFESTPSEKRSTEITVPKPLKDATNENMPPPAYKPKRGRKKIKKEVDSSDTENEGVRLTRSKRTVKQEVIEPKTAITKPVRESSKSTRNTRTRTKRGDSDVVIQEVPVPLITITDSDSDNEPLVAKPKVPSVSSAVSEAESNAEELTDKNKGSDTDEDEPLQARVHKQKIKKATRGRGRKPKDVKNEEVKKHATEVELSMYEDALSDNQEKRADKIAKQPVVNIVPLKNIPADTKDNSKNINNVVNTTITLQSNASQLNSTHIISKDVVSPIVNNNVSSIPQLNSTHVIHSSPQTPNMENILKEKGIAMNCTVVLHKMNETVTLSAEKRKDSKGKSKESLSKENGVQWQKAKECIIPPSLDNLLTDDDDSISASKLPKKTPEKKAEVKKGIKTKPMFSPYANSPVKKRVAAFEKLGNDIPDMPTRVTRTKTRNMKAEKENEQKNSEIPRAIAKPKFTTPISSNKLPPMFLNTDGKQYRTQGLLGNKYNTSTMSSDISLKAATTVKPTRAELQERREEEQKKRIEKEDEVKRKKEAMMQAKIDEQRRKREEKQLRAQKAREAKDREKEEKLRQMLQEKEDKQQEELQKKREWAAKKAAEMEERRKFDEQIRLAKIREQEEKRRLDEERRRKLAIKPPPLPTEDCEDSDSSSECVRPKKVGPPWSQKKELHPKLLAQRHIPNEIIREFYQMQATTPDLREIFETIDERALRRNSSAVWNTPPRYSTMPKY